MPIRSDYYEDATDLNDDYVESKNAGREGKLKNRIERFYGKQQCQTVVEVRIVNPEADGKKVKKEVVLETKIADGQYPEWNENL